MKLKLKYFLLTSFALTILITSCEDLIEVSRPKTQLIKATVFEDDLTAIAAVSGLYTGIRNGLGGGGPNSGTYLSALSSDDLIVDQVDILGYQFYQNSILSINTSVEAIWLGTFNVIYVANSIVEGLEKSNKVTTSLKNQLIGEAKFIRAFSHFYLVNLFGDVPYITTTDYRINGLVSRTPVSQVYEKIVIDLLDAKALLSEDYSYSLDERVRVNKWVATALLARVYLYMEHWAYAEEQSTTLINKTSLFGLSKKGELNKVFLKNSFETIWQLIPPHPQKYTTEGSVFNRPNFSAGIATISNELFNAFETGDDRKTEWVGLGDDGENTWYYPLKYKETNTNGTGAEYSTVLRLAEQYLIRAEARAKQDKLIGPNSAESDINIIRDRANLPPTTAVTQQELLTAIEQERRVELFTEWGHRWLDLKRTERATTVLELVKTNWDDTDALYPIPFSELQLNPNMTQNDGY